MVKSVLLPLMKMTQNLQVSPRGNSQVDELRSGALLLPDHGGHLVVVGLAGGQLGVLVVLVQLHDLDLLRLGRASDLESGII